MKITLTPTTTFTEINGVRCRVWRCETETETGAPLEAAIAMVRVPTGADNSEFERELEEKFPPRAFDARFFVA